MCTLELDRCTAILALTQYNGTPVIKRSDANIATPGRNRFDIIGLKSGKIAGCRRIITIRDSLNAGPTRRNVLNGRTPAIDVIVCTTTAAISDGAVVTSAVQRGIIVCLTVICAA